MTQVLTTRVKKHRWTRVFRVFKVTSEVVMQERTRTLTIKVSEDELHMAHALADAGDESIGRYVRRVLANDYERRFGDAPPPKAKLKPGPGKRTTNRTK